MRPENLDGSGHDLPPISIESQGERIIVRIANAVPRMKNDNTPGIAHEALSWASHVHSKPTVSTPRLGNAPLRAVR